MITYTLTDNWAASDPAQVDPALRKQARDESLTLEEQETLAQSIRDAAAVTPDAADIAELDALHDRIRPDVPEGGTYQVIALDAHRNAAGKWSGILNCRVNGAHAQVRF